MNLKRAGVVLCSLAVTGVFAGTVAGMPPKHQPTTQELQLAACREITACNEILQAHGRQAALGWMHQHHHPVGLVHLGK